MSARLLNRAGRVVQKHHRHTPSYAVFITVPFVVLMMLAWPALGQATENGEQVTSTAEQSEQTTPAVVLSEDAQVASVDEVPFTAVTDKEQSSTETPVDEGKQPAQNAIALIGNPISLGAGESIVLSVYDALRVAVAEPKVADVAVVSRSEVLVSGRSPGETTLHIWDKSGLQTLGVRVYENTAPLVQQLETRLGLPGVKAWMHQGTVVLEGSVDNLSEKERAVQVAGAYGKVVDLLQVRVATPTQQLDNTPTEQLAAVTSFRQDAGTQEQLAELNALIADPNLQLRVMNDALVMDGSFASPQAQERARHLAALYFTKVVDVSTVREPAQIDQPELATTIAAAINRPTLMVRTAGNRLILEGTLRDQNELARALSIAGGYGKEVVNLVSLTSPLQVALKVHVLEVDHTGEGELGVTWGSFNGGVLEPNNFYFGELAIAEPLQRLLTIGNKVQALVDDGHAKILAAPTLLTLSGETAYFLAGGEVPVGMPSDDNKILIEWKEYGVRLEMKPTVDALGYVTVSLIPEVSTLDWANAIRVSGVAMPALRTRRTQTQVRVDDGATLVLGGLLNQEESKQVNKLPILGDLPVLGRLFRSEKFSKGETELLFLVTPYVLKEGETLEAEVVVSPGALNKGTEQPQRAIFDMMP